ncbi:sugar ABC transporter substrate-binding protein [Candidatus Electronema sp. TJ]|uniref:sugar ABC transporter substrate-binding protein n=1 Tax=Candidatus Electronema sp. TJ TaxID=3401573 RepID=UPI003AA98BD3
MKRKEMTVAAAGCLLFFFMLAARLVSAEEHKIIFWHKESDSTKFIDLACSEFSKENNVILKAEYIPVDQLKQELLKWSLRGKMPDVVFVPSDFIGIHAQLRLSEIPSSLKNPQISEECHATASSCGKLYGAPVLGGNHLMLLYNKRFVRQPAATWTELATQRTELERQDVELIGWNYNEMYWFVSFLGAFGGWPMKGGKITLDSQAMQEALRFYKSLADQGLVSRECGYDCCAKLFFAGKFAYALNGDWAYAQAEQALGENLGVAVIPALASGPAVPMFSTHVLIFPQDSLNGSKGEVLKKFILFMQSVEMQRRMRRELKRIPVHQKVLAEFQQEADANQQKILRQLELARAMPSEPGMTFAWEGMRKGFHRFMTGSVDAAQAAQLMQRIAENEMRRHAQAAAP